MSTFKTVAVADPNAVPVEYDREHDILTIPVPNGWDDVKPYQNKVLRFEGRVYTFTGWNSDRNVAYFKRAVSVATVETKSR